MERLTERKYGSIVSTRKEETGIMCSCFCNGCSQGAGNCKYAKEMIEKLAEYEDMEEQGLLLKPKCKPGDIVWEANKERNIVSEYEVTSIRYGINKTFHYMWVLRNGIYSDLDGFWDKDFDKTIFLTQAKAEEALKGMEGR